MEEISLFQSLFVYVLAGFLIVGLVMAVGAHVLIRRMIVRPLLEAGEIFSASPRATSRAAWRIAAATRSAPC